jgi:hypothetical protein
VPIGVIVAPHTEVRSAHDFKIVGQARVPDGKVIEG